MLVIKWRTFIVIYKVKKNTIVISATKLCLNFCYQLFLVIFGNTNFVFINYYAIIYLFAFERIKLLSNSSKKTLLSFSF